MCQKKFQKSGHKRPVGSQTCVYAKKKGGKISRLCTFNAHVRITFQDPVKDTIQERIIFLETMIDNLQEIDTLLVNINF